MTDTISRNIIFIIIMLLLTALVVSDPSYAAAATGSASGLGNVDNVLQSIVTMMTGTTAKLIATICVAAVGIGWMYGFIDLRKAAYCLIGIGIVFGASALVSKLTSAS
ncbi:VirB2 type IV secretion protein [Bartonella henselae]|uniref:Type IV secretion system pilin protein VirB2 n=1 Tax=Bartonella henselae (strain ATCC 49882 / DSM 28221 / CCUG 30454 / Houston 1) TaxID=283166 RepID=VIRB2_BARHE|nr:type IV secretion system protein VirB2 [Bartonella henselae]Q9R3F2.1 RecName: Full=Type IV secretion system protein virB2; Flags: Precursor [Bartonella henselae str. Houston-1]AAD48919.1 VirB2 [Bartonella henselae str. Houston-1]AAF00940.1 VirB2 homolog [Bartonella henselae str. Houston-1]ATP12773.1 type IV secretion system protein virB2 [Bartonella henselae]ETS07492.1 type IV secretion system protein virB2 [Bartonella henselae JK 50]ETS07729.1 type IV secretion system protein virB2 [Barto